MEKEYTSKHPDKLGRIRKLIDDGINEIQMEEEGINPLSRAKMAIIDAYLHGIARACMELLTDKEIEDLAAPGDGYDWYINEDGYFMPIVNSTQFYTDGQD